MRINLLTKPGLSSTNFNATRQPIECAISVAPDEMLTLSNMPLTSLARDAMLILLKGEVGERP